MRAPKLQRRRDGMPSRWQNYCNVVELPEAGSGSLHRDLNLMVFRYSIGICSFTQDCKYAIVESESNTYSVLSTSL
jgi:hypothetical protein